MVLFHAGIRGGDEFGEDGNVDVRETFDIQTPDAGGVLT